MNLNLITSQISNLSRGVGMFLREEVQKLKGDQVEFKGRHNLVTYVDKEAERRIMEELHKILPEAGFIAEESPGLKPSGEFNWIIDPLDGTTNFIHGLPVFSISIALAYKQEIISGVIYEVNQDECFYAWKDGGAFLNGEKIRVSQTDKLDNALLATGFPYYDYSLLDQYLALFKFFMQNSRGVRRLGSAAVDLAYVACGRFDAFYEYGLNPWDVAAGIILVKEAGGICFDFNGGDDYLYGREIITSNQNIHQELFKSIKKHFA